MSKCHFVGISCTGSNTINIEFCFLQYKSDLYTRDHEGLGPLDIVMKDRALQTGLPPAG